LVIEHDDDNGDSDINSSRRSIIRIRAANGDDNEVTTMVVMEEEEEEEQQSEDITANVEVDSGGGGGGGETCRLCQHNSVRTFKTAQALARHMRQAHSSRTAQPYPANNYPSPLATFNRAAAPPPPVPRSSAKGGVFKCMFCDKVLSHPSNLKRHIRTAHFESSDMKLYTCETCGKTFKAQNGQCCRSG
jgi:hypothetical protein